MPRASDTRIGLAELLTDLEAELGKVRSYADDRDLSFRVDGATLEVDVSYTPSEYRDTGTEAPPEFAIVVSAPAKKDDPAVSRRPALRLSVHMSRWPKTAADELQDIEVASLLPPPLPSPSVD